MRAAAEAKQGEMTIQEVKATAPAAHPANGPDARQRERSCGHLAWACSHFSVTSMLLELLQLME